MNLSIADFAPASFIEREIERQLTRLSADPKFRQKMIEQTSREGWSGYSMLLIIKGINSFFGVITDEGYKYLGRQVIAGMEPTARTIIRPMWYQGKEMSVKQVLYRMLQFQKSGFSGDGISPFICYKKGGADIIAKDGRVIFHAMNMLKFFESFDLSGGNFEYD